MPECPSETWSLQHTIVYFSVKTFRNDAFELGIKRSKKM
jgi:hypothetical protein